MQFLPLLNALLLAVHTCAQTLLSADGLQYLTGTGAWRPNVWSQRRLLFEGRNYSAALPPPNMQYKDPLIVKIGLTVVKVDFDILSSTLTLGIWLRLKWLDERLLYDPDVVFGRNPDGTPAYDSETKVPMPMSTGDNVNIWVPDIYCVNATDSVKSMHQVHALISHSQSEGLLNHSDGLRWNVFLSRPGTINVHCSADLEAFPFDRPRCPLDFESWGFSGVYLILENMTEGWQLANDMPLSIDYEFDRKGPFSWIESYTQISDSDGSHMASRSKWSKYRVVMHLNRLPSYHIKHAVVPLTMVVILGAFTFWLPIRADSSGSDERLGYTVTLLLTIIAIMLFTAEKRPAIAVTTWLDKWQARSLLLSSIPIVETVAIFWLQNLFDRREHKDDDDDDDEPLDMCRKMSVADEDRAMTKSAAKALKRAISTVKGWTPKTVFLFLGPCEPFNIDNWFQVLFPMFVVFVFGNLPMEIFNFGPVRGAGVFFALCVLMGILIEASFLFILRRFYRACREGLCGLSPIEADMSGATTDSHRSSKNKCGGRAAPHSTLPRGSRLNRQRSEQGQQPARASWECEEQGGQNHPSSSDSMPWPALPCPGGTADAGDGRPLFADGQHLASSSFAMRTHHARQVVIEMFLAPCNFEDRAASFAGDVRRPTSRTLAPFRSWWRPERALLSESYLVFIDKRSGRVSFCIYIPSIRQVTAEAPDAASRAGQVSVGVFAGDCCCNLVFWAAQCEDWARALLRAKAVIVADGYYPFPRFLPLAELRTAYAGLAQNVIPGAHQLRDARHDPHSSMAEAQFIVLLCESLSKSKLRDATRRWRARSLHAGKCQETMVGHFSGALNSLTRVVLAKPWSRWHSVALRRAKEGKEWRHESPAESMAHSLINLWDPFWASRALPLQHALQGVVRRAFVDPFRRWRDVRVDVPLGCNSVRHDGAKAVVQRAGGRCMAFAIRACVLRHLSSAWRQFSFGVAQFRFDIASSSLQHQLEVEDDLLTRCEAATRQRGLCRLVAGLHRAPQRQKASALVQLQALAGVHEVAPGDAGVLAPREPASSSLGRGFVLDELADAIAGSDASVLARSGQRVVWPGSPDSGPAQSSSQPLIGRSARTATGTFGDEVA